MRRTDRLFELMQLFRGGRFWRGADLAETLNVSLRTIYRDIDTLVASGVDIEGERGVGYILRAPIFLPPMNLTTAELEALHLGAAMVIRAGDGELAEGARRLLAKIDDVLPQGHPRSGHDWGTMIYSGSAASPPHLALVRKAVRARHSLTIKYGRLSGAVSERVIRPLQVEFWGQVWTCTAWCELRNDFRAFRLDRITTCTGTGDTFLQKPGQRLSDYLSRLQNLAADP